MPITHLFDQYTQNLLLIQYTKLTIDYLNLTFWQHFLQFLDLYLSLHYNICSE